MKLEDLLRMAVDRDASDIHLVAGIAPMVRINGQIQRSELSLLNADETEEFAKELLTEEEFRFFQKERDYDSSFDISGAARFRVNFHYQHSTIALAIRIIPLEVPEFSQLGLPDVVLDLATRHRGLFLVTGATGSGKSTTLAAIVEHLNKNTDSHIVTVEDPIEFVHIHRKGFVEQREVRKDTKSFLSGLTNALRQDPDVILVGEMRDYETVSVAVTAAETGHLVLATLHTLDSVSTVDRIVDIFPPNQQSQVRIQLAESLLGICSQMLLPRSGGGRVVGCEVLISNPAVRNLIRESDTSKIISQLELGSRFGMVTFDQSLCLLNRDGQISTETALRYARDPEELKKKIFGE